MHEMFFFKIASDLSTPLALGGLFAAILFLLIRQIIDKDIFQQLTSKASAGIIKNIINKLFLLALISMILGFIGYIVPSKKNQESFIHYREVDNKIIKKKQLSGITANDIDIDLRLRIVHSTATKNNLYLNYRIIVDKIIITEIPNNINTFISVDNKDYYDIKNNKLSEIPFKKFSKDKLFVKFKSNKNSYFIGPVVKTGFIKKSLIKLLERDQRGFVYCNYDFCKVNNNILCSTGASYFKLGISKEHMNFIYELDKCSGQEQVSIRCFSPPEIFKLCPKENIYASLEFNDGGEITFQTIVHSNGYKGNRGGWVELTPKLNQINVPYAAARIREHPTDHYPLLIQLGTGGCQYTKLLYLYDIDGSGFIEAGSFVYEDNVFGVHQIKLLSEIAIAIIDKNGQQIGPFRYYINIDKLLQSRPIKAHPRLKCSATHSYYSKKERYWSCYASTTHASNIAKNELFLTWKNVEKVEYGFDIDHMDQTINVQISNNQIIDSLNTDKRVNDKHLIFDVIIPNYYKSIYYRIFFRSGKIAGPIKLQLY